MRAASNAVIGTRSPCSWGSIAAFDLRLARFLTFMSPARSAAGERKTVER
jgi:hypothetical protein